MAPHTAIAGWKRKISIPQMRNILEKQLLGSYPAQRMPLFLLSRCGNHFDVRVHKDDQSQHDVT